MVRATRSGIFSPEMGQSPFWKETKSGACSIVKLSPCTPVEEKLQQYQFMHNGKNNAACLKRVFPAASFSYKLLNQCMDHKIY